MAMDLISAKGRIVLRLESRKKLGTEPGTRIEAEQAGDKVILRPAHVGGASRCEEADCPGLDRAGDG
jgi:bifunctional DNA-binding transcriptional regulator/antitoxin component of YhaV-PrlF toxin-antitoxin module